MYHEVDFTKKEVEIKIQKLHRSRPCEVAIFPATLELLYSYFLTKNSYPSWLKHGIFME
jgi:hypothetical protein